MTEHIVPWFGALTGVAALLTIAYRMWTDHRSDTSRKGQAEAAKAVLDVNQAEAALPHVQRALELGNVSEAVTIQQQLLNTLRAHIAWQDEELEKRHQEIMSLRGEVAQRDALIEELVVRVDEAEKKLSEARQFIETLRGGSASAGEKEAPRG